MILSKSKRSFKSLISASAFFLGASQLLSILIGLVTTVIWTRTVNPEIFGQYKVILSIISFVGTFTFLGAGQSALMSASSGADGNFPILAKKKLLFNLFGSFVLILFVVYFSFVSPKPSISISLIIGSLIYPIYNLSDIWYSWLNGKKRFKSLAFQRSLTAFIALLSSVLFCFTDKTSVIISIVIYMVLISIQNIFVFSDCHCTTINTIVDKASLRFGSKASFAFLFNSLLSLDYVLFNRIFPADQVALYAVVLVIPEILKTILKVLGQLVSPKVFSGSPITLLWHDLSRPFFKLLIISFIVGIVGFYLIPLLIPLLFSNTYLVAGGYAKWLWLVTAVCGPFSFLGSALLSTKNSIYLYLPNIGYPCILIALYLMFVNYGVSGMIWAKSLSTILLSAFYICCFTFHLNREANNASS